MNYSQGKLLPDGLPGATSPPSHLVDYGIHNEKSDLRAHVCVNARIVYVYPTLCGVEAIGSGRYPARPASQNGYRGVTAWGYIVPPDEISRCLPIAAKALIEKAGFECDDSTTIKGEKAVWVVANLLRIGYFPLPVEPKLISEAEMQIEGTDIFVQAKYRIQVKCDYLGGKGERCTGNLYLQTAEINPLRKK